MSWKWVVIAKDLQSPLQLTIISVRPLKRVVSICSTSSHSTGLSSLMMTHCWLRTEKTRLTKVHFSMDGLFRRYKVFWLIPEEFRSWNIVNIKLWSNLYRIIMICYAVCFWMNFTMVDNTNSGELLLWVTSWEDNSISLLSEVPKLTTES